MSESGLWIPKTLKPARKFIAVVFWFSRRLDHIRIGLPEQYPIPRILVEKGYEKIVCRTANDVQIWSQKMRDQDRRQEEQTDEQRDAFEGPILDTMRKDIMHRIANARNAINRDFLKQTLIKLDEYEDQRRKDRRESYQHIEAYEDGK